MFQQSSLGAALLLVFTLKQRGLRPAFTQIETADGAVISPRSPELQHKLLTMVCGNSNSYAKTKNGVLPSLQSIVAVPLVRDEDTK